MKTAGITDVTQEEFDSAVQTVIAGIKASDPKLDTRVGTVLRSLLVNPEARLDAVTSKQIQYTRQATSLKTLREAEEAGDTVDADDVNAVMSNFNLTSSVGTYAEGLIKVQVADGTRTYAIPEGTVFSTTDGLEFSNPAQVVAGATSSATTSLYTGTSGYFFLVPVKAVKIGAVYNIPQGTSISTSYSIFSFVNAGAYKSFNGGSDTADLTEEIAKIPSGLSIRGFVNRNACEGMLRDKFDSGDNPIVACSVVGYDNATQRRDKHNLFGVGVGGRIDLYVRNFQDLHTETETVTGTLVSVSEGDSGDGAVYSITLNPETFGHSGIYWVKDISCISDVNSPLEFSCVRTAYKVDETWHDFDVSKNASEVFNTVWGGLTVTVKEVPPDTGDSTSSSSDDEWSKEREFKVTAYTLPQIDELQEYVDGDEVRSVSTDVVVRCPVICNVSVSASVIYDPSNPMDANDAKYRIRKYINSLGFVKRLTRSEIVHILKDCGALSVDLGVKDMLYGTLYDAYGKEYNLSGDSLCPDGLAEDGAMLSSDTVVFAAEPENIQLSLEPSK